MKKRKARTAVFVSLVLCGGLIAQFGGCLLTGFNGGLLGAVDFCALLGPDCVLGPLAPCGDPTTTADDLLVDCPKAPATTGT